MHLCVQYAIKQGYIYNYEKFSLLLNKEDTDNLLFAI